MSFLLQKEISHITRATLISFAFVISILPGITCSSALYVNDPSSEGYTTGAAGYFTPICRQLTHDQTEIENHIAETYDDDARLFVASSLATNSSDYSQIMESSPSQLYYTDGCPTINVELPQTVRQADGRFVAILNGKKIKKVATCSTSTGRILKWTGYTNINPKVLAALKQQHWCLNTLHDTNTDLTPQ